MDRESINKYYRERRAKDPAFRKSAQEAVKRYREKLKKRFAEDPELYEAYKARRREESKRYYYRKKGKASEDKHKGEPDSSEESTLR